MAKQITWTAEMKDTLRNSATLEEGVIEALTPSRYATSLHYWTVTQVRDFITQSCWDTIIMPADDDNLAGWAISLSDLRKKDQSQVVRSVLDRLTKQGKLTSALGDMQGNEVRSWELVDWQPQQ